VLGVDQLKRVRQPTQFIWGDNDPFGGLGVARQAVGLMPDAKLHEMKAGHLPFLDNPAECGRVIREFLSP
jgi:pimeloyl-ACP methyl ester carboxylesterase